MKKSAAFGLAVILALSSLSANVLGQTDDFILTDPVRITYTGRSDATATIANIQFNDVAPGYWAREAIARDGALNLVKGYAKSFRPEAGVSKEEAIAFALRTIGLEADAVALGATLTAQRPGSSVASLWSLGYLQLARDMGMITPRDYLDALTEDQGALAEGAFNRASMAAREDVAYYIYYAMRYKSPDAFPPKANLQAIFQFGDWQSVSADRAEAVDDMALKKIMNGYSDGTFRPKSGIKRAEMAQVLANLDSIYFAVNNYSKKTGRVGAIRDNQYTTTNQANLWRNVYIRSSDGGVEVLQYNLSQTSSPQSGAVDAVVYGADGRITGMGGLNEGDIVEYIVDNNSNTVLYILVTGTSAPDAHVQGTLYKIDPDEKSINIKAGDGKQFIYSLAEGLLTNRDGVDYIKMDEKLHNIKELPYGSKLNLTLTGRVVKEINYVGQAAVLEEIRGIVVENKPDFGYITIIDNKGDKITKNYYTSELVVEKTQYYDNEDEIGYIDQVFPNFQYDPRDTDIGDIEPGDVVFLRISSDNPSYISGISASTNYIMKYGKIKTFTDNGAYADVLLEFENKQTAWYDMAKGIFITKDGKPITPADVKTGDWVRVLVNEAIIDPGHIIESVKEMTVEGPEHFISNIVKGNLSGINPTQNKLIVEGVETLQKTGWSGYKDLQEFSISGGEAEYYYNDKRISLDYALRYFKNGGAYVYIAMENNYAGERVKKVSFRAGRDEMLDPNMVVYSDGSGAFNMQGFSGNIGTDGGTIVRRYGRLVDGNAIMASDYVQTSLNGGNYAAVIDITEYPDTSQIQLARGRIATVNDGKSFKVQSLSMFNGGNWVYTPVQREFAIDNKTLFLDGGGYVDPGTFVGYTDDSVVNKVYNIITDGSRASYVIDSPYANKALRGTIYALGDGSLSLKDVYIQDPKTFRWNPVSNTNNTITVTTQENTIIGKNNQIIFPGGLTVGDTLLVMTDTLPDKPGPGSEITGYIIMVEK